MNTNENKNVNKEHYGNQTQATLEERSSWSADIKCSTTKVNSFEKRCQTSIAKDYLTTKNSEQETPTNTVQIEMLPDNQNNIKCTSTNDITPVGNNPTTAMPSSSATVEAVIAPATHKEEEVIKKEISTSVGSVSPGKNVATSCSFQLVSEGGQQLTENNTSDNKVDYSMAIVPTTAISTINTKSTETATVDSLPKGLSHAASEPTLGIQMRMQQKQKIKSYHDAKQTTVWRTESVASNPSISCTTKIHDNKDDPYECVAASASSHNSSSNVASSPCLRRKSSDVGTLMPRRVSFPKNDKELVTGYLEPANPWEQAYRVKSISEIAELYVLSCQKHNTVPLQSILDHLKTVDLCNQTRQALLSLRSIKLTPNDCEPLEEVFKRVQYKAIDISDCSLDDSSVSALCQMIEYYEAANELDISSNSLTNRGWLSCTYMVGRSQELQILNAEGNPMSITSAEQLGNSLKTSNMHTLKLEHCGLKGGPFLSLCNSLYNNKVLKEMWLAYNDLDCTDADHLGKLLCSNHCIELIDISNNNIRDEGMVHLVAALIQQASDLERHSTLHRTAAIEDEENFSAMGSTAPEDSENTFNENNEDILLNFNQHCLNSSIEAISAGGDATIKQISNIDEPVPETKEKHILFDEVEVKSPLSKQVDIEGDDVTENTMRSTGTVKSFNQSATGKSMLDKLLSMNSDSSSSEEGPSIISTDTLAACCSEDISVLSDATFDSATANTTDKNLIMHSTLAASSTATTTTISPSPNRKISVLPEIELPVNTHLIVSSFTGENELSHQNITTTVDKSSCALSNSDVRSYDSTTATTCSPHGSSISTHSNENDANNSSCSSGFGNCDSQIPSQMSEAFRSSVKEKNSLHETDVFEVTAEDSCFINVASGRLRTSGNSKLVKTTEDYEDTHSTDSAFESASEGDISRHLPDEFSRLSTSLESTRLDDVKEMNIETGTIASESTEYLVEEGLGTPSTTLASVLKFSQTKTLTHEVPEIKPKVFSTTETNNIAKVTIASECLKSTKEKETSTSFRLNPVPTPPPPSTSPGGASMGMRRTESTSAYLNHSTRIQSQSSESLCSESSLDNSLSTDPNFTDKLTKNDTLSRRHLVDNYTETTRRAHCGLKALTVWSNNLTKESATSISNLLSKTISLELLNIGKNCLSNDFIAIIKDSLIRNSTLTTLGLQSAHLSAKGIEILASILTFGGNSKLQRIDIRDNKLEVESLTIMAEVLKSNKTITQIDINDEPKRLAIGSDAHLDYARVLQNVRSMCSRNEKIQSQLQTEISSVGGGSNRCRGGYYLGSRKISLTCHSRPLVDLSSGTVSSSIPVSTAPSSAAKLEIKRKTGVRLRSPGPSPPTVSPSSSPNRSRFQVSRVHDVSPLTSPLAQTPPPHPQTTKINALKSNSISSCVSIPTVNQSTASLAHDSYTTSASLPMSNSLPVLTTGASSTQTIKRLSVSPRSRFHVRRIYEDTLAPLGNSTTPIKPPLDPPPTPMLKTISKSTLLEESTELHPIEPTNLTNLVELSNVEITTASAPVEVSSESYDFLLHSTPLIVTTPAPSTLKSLEHPISVPLSETSNSAQSSTDPPSKNCPIVIFGDNDLTLTKESAANLTATTPTEYQSLVEPASTEDLNTAPQQQNRGRKMSWIANPTAVDKLLNLFNPSSIFQRSSSPELKEVPNQTPTQSTSDSNLLPSLAQPQKIKPSTSLSQSIAPNCGHENSLISESSNNTSVMSNAAAATLEQSRSFLDAASRQFRQMLSFGNDCGAVSSTGCTISTEAPPEVDVLKAESDRNCISTNATKSKSNNEKIDEVHDVSETEKILTGLVEDEQKIVVLENKSHNELEENYSSPISALSAPTTQNT